MQDMPDDRPIELYELRRLAAAAPAHWRLRHQLPVELRSGYLWRMPRVQCELPYVQRPTRRPVHELRFIWRERTLAQWAVSPLVPAADL